MRIDNDTSEPTKISLLSKRLNATRRKSNLFRFVSGDNDARNDNANEVNEIDVEVAYQDKPNHTTTYISEKLLSEKYSSKSDNESLYNGGQPLISKGKQNWIKHIHQELKPSPKESPNDYSDLRQERLNEIRRERGLPEKSTKSRRESHFESSSNSRNERGNGKKSSEDFTTAQWLYKKLVKAPISRERTHSPKRKSISISSSTNTRSSRYEDRPSYVEKRSPQTPPRKSYSNTERSTSYDSTRLSNRYSYGRSSSSIILDEAPFTIDPEMESNPLKKFLVYKGIDLHGDDIRRLLPGEMLNDAVIDFYLLNLQTTAASDSMYIFNTQFYPLLKRKSEIGRIAETVPSQSIKLFEKEFIFIPVNEACHWSLVILCYPGQPKHPNHCILYCDSLYSSPSLVRMQYIRRYLSKRFVHESGSALAFDEEQYPVEIAYLPQQRNAVDCGVYMILYIEHFVRKGIRQFPVQIRDLFGPSSVVSKRKEIYQLIQKLRKEYSPVEPTHDDTDDEVTLVNIEKNARNYDYTPDDSPLPTFKRDGLDFADDGLSRKLQYSPSNPRPQDNQEVDGESISRESGQDVTLRKKYEARRRDPYDTDRRTTIQENGKSHVKDVFEFSPLEKNRKISEDEEWMVREIPHGKPISSQSIIEASPPSSPIIVHRTSRQKSPSPEVNVLSVPESPDPQSLNHDDPPPMQESKTRKRPLRIVTGDVEIIEPIESHHQKSSQINHSHVQKSQDEMVVDDDEDILSTSIEDISIDSYRKSKRRKISL